MTRLTPLAKLRAPLGGQEIELQQIDFEGGGLSLLRTRIREGSRFTIFDIDPVTAAQWGQALIAWAASPLPVPAADHRHAQRARHRPMTDTPAAVVDVAFLLQGQTLALARDHRHALAAALTQALPWLAAVPGAGVR